MVQTERYKGTMKNPVSERQGLSISTYLEIAGDGVLLLLFLSHTEHGQGLIEPDNFSPIEMFRHRAGKASGTGSEVQYPFISREM